MHSSLAVSALFNLAGAASPTDQSSASRAASTNTEANTWLGSVVDGSRSLALPVGVPTHEDLYRTIGPSHSDKVSFTISTQQVKNGIFIDHVSDFAIDGQSMNLSLDSGSTAFWVFSSEQFNQPGSLTLEEQAAFADHSFFETRSLTPISTTPGWSVDLYRGWFNNFQAWGNKVFQKPLVIKDDITGELLAAFGQNIQAASFVPPLYARWVTHDGVLGLAPDSSFLRAVRPFLTSEMFCVCVKEDGITTFDFGFIDTATFERRRHYRWLPVKTQEGFWQVEVDEFSWPKEARKSSPDINRIGPAIVTTAAALIHLPAQIVHQFWDETGGEFVEEANGYVFSCSMTPHNFQLRIGGIPILFEGQYLNHGPIKLLGRSRFQDPCFGKVQSNDGMPFSVIGKPFFDEFYVMHDMANSLLGIVKKV